MACSQTGSGKTLAFLIPTVHRLMKQKPLSKKDPRVLILAPTRELAKQVYQEAKWLTSGLGIQPALLIGGDNYNDQCKLLKRNPTLLIGTAGRVSDHLNSRNFFLHGLELLIFDEADRMLDLGFADALLQINQFADHRKRQTLLFSATLDNVGVNQLATNLVSAPVRINIGLSTAKHDNITQHFYLSDDVDHKDALLNECLQNISYNQAIVFTATREDTERLADYLNTFADASKLAIALRGDLPQNQRANVMAEFSRGQHSVLVTTDVASRGLDLPKVGLVINYDLPKQADEYIHRIGRTGRAGQSGVAVSLIGRRDWQSFVSIQAHLDYVVEAVAHDSFPAKFSGIKTKPKKNASANKPKRKLSALSNSEQRSTPKKRIKTMEGQDIGDLPIKKKKTPVDNIDN